MRREARLGMDGRSGKTVQAPSAPLSRCAAPLPQDCARPVTPSLGYAFKRFGIAVLVSLATIPACGHSQAQTHPKASPPSPHVSSSSAHPPSAGHVSGGPHLSEWMRQNQGLSPQEQSRKLQQEPGFKQLPPEKQQQLTNRLQELNRMPPEQRQRTLERVENMERLPVERQQQIRASAARLGSLPPERQTAVRDAMQGLRNVPPGLRQSELNSQRYGQLSPEERGIVGDLLSVEPYHPPPPPPR